MAADHGPTTIELVEVKAEDILDERRAFYGSFMNGTTYAIGAVVGALVLMWIFLV
jgi:hypothetical protein